MPQRELFRKDTEKWMRRYDRPAYQLWIDILRPEIGKSIDKVEFAAKLTGRSAGIQRMGWGIPVTDSEKSVKRAFNRINRRLQCYETMLGASITFSFLHKLAMDRKKKLLRWRLRQTQS